MQAWKQCIVIKTRKKTNFIQKKEEKSDNIYSSCLFSTPSFTRLLVSCILISILNLPPFFFQHPYMQRQRFFLQKDFFPIVSFFCVLQAPNFVKYNS